MPRLLSSIPGFNGASIIIIIVIIIISSFCLLVSSDQEKRETRWTALGHVDVNVSLVLTSKSLLGCAIKCAGISVCRTFCYMQTTSERVCFLQSATGDPHWFSNSATPSCFVYALKPCPADRGYDLYQGQCVKVNLTPQTFKSANETCFQDRGHLYIGKSYDHLSILVQYLRGFVSPIPNYYWVGADDRESEGTFHWSDGASLPVGDPMWYTGEPNNQGGEDCVALRLSKSRLQDDDCPNLMAFICQVDID